ncbi:MAG TPA: hypothetical protein VGI21_03900 [Streptosporangiaceae bacterium]
MHPGEVITRLALTAAVLAVIAVSPVVWVAAPVALVAIAATAELAVRPYADDPAGRLLLACGAVVTGLILAGLALNLLPEGLTRLTWALAWLAISVAVLIWRRHSATDLSWLRNLGRSGRALALGAWMVAAVVILAGAVVLAQAGVRNWDRRPDLAFSVVSRTPRAVVVQIQATSTTRRYQIVATRQGQAAGHYTSPFFTVAAGGSGIQLDKQVPLGASGQWIIDLQADGTTVRKLQVVMGRAQ